MKNRLPRKLKKQLRNKERIANALQIVSMAIGLSTTAMQSYMESLAAYHSILVWKKMNQA